MDLSKDILVEIANRLDLKDTLNFALTCKNCYNCIFENENFWLRRSKKEFSIPMKKEKYKNTREEISKNKFILSSFNSSGDDVLFSDMPNLVEFDQYIKAKGSFTISVILLGEEMILYENLCNKMNHFGGINEEEKETLKRLIYKSINLNCENIIEKLENTIKQYVYLNLIPLSGSTKDLENIPLFFRD